MRGVRRGGVASLRFYRWSPACLSLGRNQPAVGGYDLDAIAGRGIEVVRRPTGGRAVLHDRELTYSVVFPEGTLGSPLESYATINRVLMTGLRSLGVDAELQGESEGRSEAPSLAPCFRQPAEGEVVVGGRKLIGSAQYHEGGVTLQHGSLLLANDQGLADSLLRSPGSTSDEPATLSEFLDPVPTWETLTRVLTSAFAEVIGCSVVPGELDAVELEDVTHLSHRYSDPAWTWRR